MQYALFQLLYTKSMYKYSYFIANLPLTIIWLTLFLKRKDFRFEILSFSFLFGFVGLLVQNIYIKDWWHPLTITNTRVGIEDFMFGFLIAGMASVVYEAIFRKKIKLRGTNSEDKSLQKFIFLNLPLAIIFFGSFAFLKLHWKT